MYKSLNKRTLLVAIPNVSTILIVAIMLVVNHAFAKPAQSSTNTTLNSGLLSYQGTLMDSDDDPLTGTYEITFRIYNAPVGGIPLWEEIRSEVNAVTVQNGLFNIMLGSLNPIQESVWQSTELFLGVQINSDAEMSPRELITGVPFAKNAGIASSVTENSITGSNIVDGSISQLDAPTLLKSANSQNEIIRSGNSVFFEGSDENGAIVINYPCFTNDTRVFHAQNGHYEANNSQVVGNNGAGLCATTIFVWPPTTNPIRIHWIVIGN